MGVPTSEVGYTPAMPRREDHEVHKGHVVALEKKKRYLYCSPNIIRVIKTRRMRLARHVARRGYRRSAFRVLVGKPEGKRPLRRPRH